MKSVLLLGALSDIAQALAREFAARGWRPLLAARQSARLAPLAQDLKLRHGVEAVVAEFDLLDTASHAAFYTALPEKPDVVICVGGYLGDTEKVRHDFAEARRVIDTNYTGAVSILDVVADDFELRKLRLHRGHQLGGRRPRAAEQLSLRQRQGRPSPPICRACATACSMRASTC
jgi:decaprenylphospho-beta-D-erythro-pentofuranosid-2-ulose 2-reductase